MNLVEKQPRIEAVDALRGFAVMAILLIHSVEHFIFPVYPSHSPAWLAALDEGVLKVVFALFAGKAYVIFALLFGFTFWQQRDNRRRRGEDFGARFLWRLLLLAGFATLNAAFFPAGDVLLLFSIVGVVLFVVRRWSDRAVFVLALILLIQPVEWYHCIRSLCDAHYVLPDLGVGAMYQQMAESTKQGDFWSFLAKNVTLGQKASLMWAVGAGRVCQTAGLFLLGLLLGRRGLLRETRSALRFWIGALIAGALLYVPLEALRGAVGDAGIAGQAAATALDMWRNLAFSVVLIASFLLLWRTARMKRIAAPLQIYGRMSLTNYVFQSVLGALIYFPVGLNLAPYCGATLSLLIGFALFAVQVAFCRWWLARYRQGMLEALWHRLTWLGSGK